MRWTEYGFLKGEMADSLVLLGVTGNGVEFIPDLVADLPGLGISITVSGKHICSVYADTLEYQEQI